MIARPCISLLLSLAVFACGEESSSPEPTPPVNTDTDQGGSGGQTTPPLGGSGAGGTPAEAGSGGASGGSSDGGQPSSDEVRGAVSLNILSPDGCSLDAQFLDFPEVPNGHPVTGTEGLAIVENGGMTASGMPVQLACKWGLKASIAMTIGVAGATRAVIFSAPTEAGEAGMSNLLLNAHDFPAQYRSTPDGPCTFMTIEADPEARSVWGQFSCGGFGTADGSDLCAIGPSFYFFENCPE